MNLNVKFTNLDCSMCEDSIQKSLVDNQKIFSIEFDLLEQTGEISFDEKLITEKEILKKIRKIGYKAYVI